MIKKTTPLNEILKIGTNCNRRNNCCKHGTGFLVNGDLEKISSFLGLKEQEVKEKYLVEKQLFNRQMLRPKIKGDKPFGECIFFDNGCKIHDVKPLQCKIGNCSIDGEELSAWFLLNYIVDKNDAESIREYDIYLKSGGKKIEGGELKDLVPDEETLKKILNFEILK